MQRLLYICQLWSVWRILTVMTWLLGCQFVYEAMVQSLQIIWDDREVYNNNPQFYEWFLSNCKNEIQLEEKRIASGLGDPRKPFYTNDMESQNNVMMSYRTQESPTIWSLKTTWWWATGPKSLPNSFHQWKLWWLIKEIKNRESSSWYWAISYSRRYKHLAADARKFF